MAIPSSSASPPGQGQLLDLVAAIPFANDGDIISENHHNALRSAVGQIAAALDDTAIDHVETVSVIPVLHGVIGRAEWRATLGFAVGPLKSADNPTAEGWLRLELPHGTTIDGMTVRGRQPTSVDSWVVSLRRLEISSALMSNVCVKEIQSTPKGQDGLFVVDVPIKTEQMTPAQASELRRVDNTKYIYMFYTTTSGAQQPDSLELRMVQVTCTR
jgi:hypothetical protein